MILKRIIIIICAIIPLCSCNEKKSSQVEQESNSNVQSIDTIDYSIYVGSPCYEMDSGYIDTSKNGVLIKYSRLNALEYSISWGSDIENLRVLPDSFYCDAPFGARPHLIDENENYLVLKSHCGNPCWQVFFLPLSKKKQPEIIGMYFDYDLNREIVVYPEADSTKNVLIVKNINTKKSQEIDLPDNCNSPIEFFCIDSLSIEDDMLYYRWSSELDGTSDKIIEKRIRLS